MTALGDPCRRYAHVTLPGTCWAHATLEEKESIRPSFRPEGEERRSELRRMLGLEPLLTEVSVVD